MSTVVHPVGPKPPRVYWVRRLVVLLVALGLVAALVAGLSAVLGGDGGSGDAQAGGDAADAAADGASDEPTQPATGPEPCAAADIALTFTADSRSYPAGTTPLLALSVTNNGPLSCTLEAGEASREVLITSGTDRIWSSLDCLADPPADLQLLASGSRWDTTVTWQRIRSDAACSTGLPEPRPGTYTAVASIAGVTSGAVVFELG